MKRGLAMGIWLLGVGTAAANPAGAPTPLTLAARDAFESSSSSGVDPGWPTDDWDWVDQWPPAETNARCSACSSDDDMHMYTAPLVTARILTQAS